MFGNGTNMLDLLRTTTGGDDLSVRVCMLHARKAIACKRDSGGVTHLYTHAFGWKPAKEGQLIRIPKKSLKWCQNNIGQVHLLSGGGYRKRNDSHRLKDSDKMGLLRKEFQVEDNPKFRSCCAWLAAVLLINVDDEAMATYMLNLMHSKNSDDEFEWMNLARTPQNCIPRTTLNQRLQKKDIKYNLKRVSRPNGISYLKLLLENDKTGQYICQFEMSDGTTDHVVGIDCNLRHIYDSYEQHAIRLSKENLDYCCGDEESLTLKRIVYCYELVKQP